MKSSESLPGTMYNHIHLKLNMQLHKFTKVQHFRGTLPLYMLNSACNSIPFTCTFSFREISILLETLYGSYVNQVISQDITFCCFIKQFKSFVLNIHILTYTEVFYSSVKNLNFWITPVYSFASSYICIYYISNSLER